MSGQIAREDPNLLIKQAREVKALVDAMDNYKESNRQALTYFELEKIEEGIERFRVLLAWWQEAYSKLVFNNILDGDGGDE